MINLTLPGSTISGDQLILGFVLALVISVFAYKVSFLTLSGSMATFILAFVIFSLGGWQWTVPILSFFIVSSILSKIREKKNPRVSIYFEKSGSRDFYQVAANGGLGGFLVVINHLSPDLIWYIMYSGIIASSCADTWATEIGTMANHRTYDIIRFRSVDQGSSGGVSLAGFAGSLMGAFFISLISLIWINTGRMYFILLITFAGFAAGILDSVLGAALQAQYRCYECNRIVDKQTHCGKNTVKYRGYSFVNNDFVNFTAGLAGGIIVFSLSGILKTG